MRKSIEPVYPTPEEIDAALIEARRLRAEAIGNFFKFGRFSAPTAAKAAVKTAGDAVARPRPAGRTAAA